MSQNTRESLSALMDGESDELELRRVLKSLPSEADAADTWRRYHLARSMMQREREVDVSVDLSAGIMARLRDEPVPSSLHENHAADPIARSSGISFARGAGVAAAVSLMVITGVQFYSSNGSGQGQGAGDMAAAPSGTVQVQPVSLAAAPNNAMASADMPMFEPTPFRINGQAGNGGLMNVSEAGFSSPSTPNSIPNSVMAQQGTSIDIGQIRLLQSYLEQHAQGAASGNGDSWMPLMRSSSVVEPLGQR